MSDQDTTPSGRPRMSRGIKLVLMGVAGAALLYSCAPAIGGMGGLGGMPYFWFLPNPFYSGSSTTTTTGIGTRTSPSTTTTTPGQTQPSTRGGFGGSAGQHESASSS